jgi:hypothetical protein
MSSIKVSKTVVKKKLVIVNPSDGLNADDAAVPKNSIWMNVHRTPKIKQNTLIWENVEDISDDENDTPQAAGKRLSTMKAVRDKIKRRAYENKLIELQNAGLFLKWSLPNPSSYEEEESTYADEYNREAYPYFHKF